MDLIGEATAGGPPAFKTKREALPGFVSDALTAIYEKSGLRKGCADLVIWDLASRHLRLVEVKCPHWDKPSVEQTKFMQVALDMGIPTAISEWEFVPREEGDALVVLPSRKGPDDRARAWAGLRVAVEATGLLVP